MQPRTGELTLCEETGGSKNKKVKTCRGCAFVLHHTEQPGKSETGLFMIKSPCTGWLKISPHYFEHTFQVPQVSVCVPAARLNDVVTGPSILCVMMLS